MAGSFAPGLLLSSLVFKSLGAKALKTKKMLLHLRQAAVTGIIIDVVLQAAARSRAGIPGTEAPGLQRTKLSEQSGALSRVRYGEGRSSIALQGPRNYSSRTTSSRIRFSCVEYHTRTGHESEAAAQGNDFLQQPLGFAKFHTQ